MVHASKRAMVALVLGFAAVLVVSVVVAYADDDRRLRFVPVSVCDTCSTLPFGVNDRNQVTGLFFDAAGKGRGFLKTGNHYDVIDIPGASL